MQASSLDTLLDRNFQTVDGFPERPDINRPSGYPDELPDDRWGEIADEDVHPFEAPAKGSESLGGLAPMLNRPLDNDEQSRIYRAIREAGFEAVALYKSRRFLKEKPFPGKWGIFYLSRSVRYLAIRMTQDYAINDALPLAYEMLRRHERYHFKADIYTMMLELVQRRQLYVPVRRSFQNHTSLFVEEALANKAIWNFATPKRGPLRYFAKDWMEIQPFAYKRFTEQAEDLIAEWAANTIDGNYHKGARRDDLRHWRIVVPPIFERATACPEWDIQTDAARPSTCRPAAITLGV